MASAAEPYGVGIAWNNVQQSITGTLQGSAQYVAAEVIVGSLLQRFSKISGRGWQNAAVVHTLSLPLQGAFQGWFESKDYKGWDAETSMDLVWQGAHGVPAYLVAGYVTDVAGAGFHMPRVDKSLALGIFGKIITRPLVGNLMPYLPNTMQEAYYVLDAIHQDMRSKSAWKKEASAAIRRRALMY